ncbi:MAG: 30S ribosomal protein S11 [Candidatus Hodgkinia cicadicola]
MNRLDLTSALIHISISENNIIATCTDNFGNTLAWTSAGERGFKGAKKASPFATQVVTEAIVRKSTKLGISTFNIEIDGAQTNRDTVLRTLLGLDITISVIKDVTPISHNGCRLAKERRV